MTALVFVRQFGIAKIMCVTLKLLLNSSKSNSMINISSPIKLNKKLCISKMEIPRRNQKKDV